jgi:hypothetical protein
VYKVRCKVLTAASMKMTAFWNMAPCSLEKVDLRFIGVSVRANRPDDGGSIRL